MGAFRFGGSVSGQRARVLRVSAAIAGSDHPGPIMDGVTGVSRDEQIGPAFEAFDFTHEQHTYEVFRGGSDWRLS